MTIQYLDPYKDDLYGKLRGDKAEAYFGVVFSEAVIHKTDDAYIIAGRVEEYKGVTRAFKPEDPLKSGLCALPIYGKEYEIRKKGKDSNWTSHKFQPSIFEKALYDLIAKDEDDWMPHNASISVSIQHIPNGMLSSLEKQDLIAQVLKNAPVNQIDSSGKLPEYTPPSNNGQRKSGGWGKSFFPEEKIEFIKKQLAKDIQADGFKEGRTLAELTDQMLIEHADNENFISIYFDLLIASVR